MKPKALIGMSGGVDSAVSAALLKEHYDVVGAFMNVWQPDFIVCSQGEDRREAMRAGAFLDIPFQVVDLEEVYKQHVVDYFLNEYKKGRVPNPDVMCNREVKFGAFLSYAKEHNFDYIATGHYARTERTEKGVRLLRGKDPKKDQSYFLWTLTQKELPFILFPVGDMEKKEVRERAASLQLPNALRKDSQGVCFIGKIDMKEFLSHYIEKKEGNVLDREGRVIGTHTGAWFFALGERHGFTIKEKTPHDTPRYVIAKDIEKNTITVSETPKEEGGRTEISLEQVNWILDIPVEGKEYGAKLRYRQEDVPCTISGNIISFKNKELASPGQSIVLYDGDICMGGGIIE